jgi:hypothetical protein
MQASVMEIKMTGTRICAYNVARADLNQCTTRLLSGKADAGRFVVSDTGIPGPSRFKATSWELVEQLRDGETGARALETLIERYWRPTYLYLCRKGFPRDKALEWTQEFFARACEKGWFKRADRHKGKFRTYLLTVLSRFVRDDRELKQGKFESGLRSTAVLLDTDQSLLIEPVTSETPEDTFLRQWARELVTTAQERLRQEWRGRDPEWAYPAYLERLAGVAEGNEITWDALAKARGLERDQVRHACRKIQKHARRILLDMLSEDGGDPDAELAELLQLAGS